jgi:hypothetical protein
MGFSSVAAFADADPDNHGHHYGQLKHRQTPPPPPAPTPLSAPATLPTTPPAANTAAASGATTTIIDIPSVVAAPISDSQAKPIKLVASSPTPEGGQPWLVLLLLPALLAAWLMVFTRAAINASRRFIQGRAAA